MERKKSQQSPKEPEPMTDLDQEEQVRVLGDRLRARALLDVVVADVDGPGRDQRGEGVKGGQDTDMVSVAGGRRGGGVGRQLAGEEGRRRRPGRIFDRVGRGCLFEIDPAYKTYQLCHSQIHHFPFLPLTTSQVPPTSHEMVRPLPNPSLLPTLTSPVRPVC